MGNDITRNETIRTRLSERTSSPMLPKPVEDIVSVKTGHAACYMKCILPCYRLGFIPLLLRLVLRISLIVVLYLFLGLANSKRFYHH